MEMRKVKALSLSGLLGTVIGVISAAFSAGATHGTELTLTTMLTLLIGGGALLVCSIFVGIYISKLCAPKDKENTD